MNEHTANPERCPLPGSERPPARAASPAAPIDPGQQISVTVVLRRRNELPAEAMADPMPRDQFTAEYGADPADVDKVTETLTRNGIRIDQVDPGSRRIRATGPAAALSRL